MRTERQSSRLSRGKRAQGHLRRLRESIASKGGLFPGKSREEVVAALRKTREEIWEEKFAHRPGQ